MTKPQAKSTARMAVEAALVRATVEQPLSAAQIAAQSGVHVTLVRTHISGAVSRGEAHNTRLGIHGPGLYAWGPREAIVIHRPNVAQPRQRLNMDSYTGERAIAIRPGADFAFTLPSLVGGESIPRVRPALISGGVLQAVGMGRQ